MSSITIRLPRELETQLRTISKEERIPISDLVRESLRRYVAVQRFRRLRAKTMPYAAAQGFLTDEDIFRAMS